jgi:hypothetical protein
MVNLRRMKGCGREVSEVWLIDYNGAITHCGNGMLWRCWPRPLQKYETFLCRDCAIAAGILW